MRDFTGVSGASGGSADDDTRWTPPVANSIVQEIATVITDADGGDTDLDPADNTQLLTAIKKMIDDALVTTASRKVGLWDGTIVAGNSVFVPFDTPFELGTQYAVQLTGWNATGSGGKDNWLQWVSKSEAGFTVVCQGTNTGGDNTLTGFDWTAEALPA